MITLSMRVDQRGDYMRDFVQGGAHFIFYEPEQWLAYDSSLHKLHLRLIWTTKK